MTTYSWLPRAIEWVEIWNVDRSLIEAAADHPLQITDDPMTAQAGYPIKRHRRGDLEVSVGFRYPDEPAIIHIHIHLPMDSTSGSTTSGGPLKKAAATAPNGLREFKQRVHDAGYRPKLQNGHVHILRPNGSLLMVTGSTPGDKQAITNAWQKFQKVTKAEATREVLHKLAEEYADEVTTSSAPEEPGTVSGKWMCPHCNDWFGPKDAEDGDVPPVCYMCRKAAWG